MVRKIVVEINGERRSGKSHVAKLIENVLKNNGYTVIITPGTYMYETAELIGTHDVTIIDN